VTRFLDFLTLATIFNGVALVLKTLADIGVFQ
jgi:hypothetical protein